MHKSDGPALIWAIGSVGAGEIGPNRLWILQLISAISFYNDLQESDRQDPETCD